MIHTLIIWNKAFNKKNHILNDIDANFNIINTFNFNWSKKHFHANLKRFYSHSQYQRKLKSFNKIISKKIKHCGDNEFLLIVFEDKSPNLTKRKTSSGTNTVNSNVFDRKKSYRKLTGGGHKIHSSDNSFETNKDLILLFGQTTEEFLNTYSKRNNVAITIDRNITGVPFWKDISQLFKVLNNSIDYVVLRNFECLPNEYNVEGHGDIDVLVENENFMSYLTGAKKMSPKKPYRCNYEININNEQVPFDFRFLGDNYYDVTWEKNILETKLLTKDTFYTPNQENHFFSLLYHAVIHKRTIGSDYIKKLESINDNFISNFKNINTEKAYSLALSKYLENSSYNFTTPIDKTVFFNQKNICYTDYGEHSYNKYKHLVSQTILEFKNNKVATQVFKYNGTFIKKANEPIISNEIKYLSLLNHSTLFPEIIKVNKSKVDSEIYLTEINGVLFSEIKRTPKFWKKRHIKNVIKTSIDILIELTEHNILHRDIRPGNIMIQKQNGLNTTVLFDFGWATSIDKIEEPFPEGLGDTFKYNEGEFSDAYSLGKSLKKQFPKFSFLKQITAPLTAITPEGYKNKGNLILQLKEVKKATNSLKFSNSDVILLVMKRIKSWFKSILNL
jgi:predicted Ser/Thr protein kinase